MKLIASTIKTFKENMRDWKVLIMVLLFSPFFIVIMYAGYGGDAMSYNMTIINQDSGVHSQSVIEKLKEVKNPDSADLFVITLADNEDQLKDNVKSKMVDIGLIIPNNYSTNLVEGASTYEAPKVQIYGSLGNSKYVVAVLMATDVLYTYGMDVQEIMLPEYFEETILEKRVATNEFESMVPGLISLSILMILFSCTASIVNENDKLTIVRLKLGSLGAINYLGGVTIVQTLIGVFAVVLSYLTALSVGYKPSGDVGALIVVSILSSISMVAVSLILASFLKTVFDVLTIGVVPFFVMMFFSGSMMPLSKVTIITIVGQNFGFADLLPLTHTASAFNKILNFDLGFKDIIFEIIMIMLLTIIYMIAAMVLYKRRRLSKA